MFVFLKEVEERLRFSDFFSFSTAEANENTKKETHSCFLSLSLSLHSLPLTNATGPRRPRQEPETLAARLPARRPLHRVRLLRVQLPLSRRGSHAAAADHLVPRDCEAACARGRQLWPWRCV